MPLGAERREILLEMSRQHDCVVFEDDYDSEFRDDSPPRPALAAEAAPMNALIQALDNAHIGAQPLEHLDWSNRQPARCKAIVIGLGNVETLAIPATVTRLTTALASVR